MARSGNHIYPTPFPILATATATATAAADRGIGCSGMSAARPTWTNAVGSARAPTMQYSSRDLTAHSKLKLRTTQQTQRVVEFERPAPQLAPDDEPSLAPPPPTGRDDEHAPPHVVEEEEEDEDDTEALLRELEKIKKEREEERARKAQEQLQKTVGGNPLTKDALASRPSGSFVVKRRWDDDVVFKHQARKDDAEPQKRFINDTLRSDFHRKFMNRYIK